VRSPEVGLASSEQCRIGNTYWVGGIVVSTIALLHTAGFTVGEKLAIFRQFYADADLPCTCSVGAVYVPLQLVIPSKTMIRAMRTDEGCGVE
jgi:hypothetical protein